MLPLLQELVMIPAVAWYESPLEEWLVDFAKKYWLPYIRESGYGVVIWNPLSKYACMAHIDEVWWKITKISDNILQFEWIGWVKPAMFVGRDIEIISSNWNIIYWLVVGPEPLKVAYENFSELTVIVDSKQISQIHVGDSLRFRAQFTETPESIFSTTLDNRVGVLALLEIIKKQAVWENYEFFDETAFFFATEEELKNKWWLYFVEKYRPKFLLIPDMIPHSFLENWPSSFPVILKKSPDYNLSPIYIPLVEDLQIQYLESNFELLKNSEPAKYERANNMSCIGIALPTYNYHHGTYCITKKLLWDFISTISTILERVKLLSNN
jgi:putative aminopeptidase FrvX